MPKRRSAEMTRLSATIRFVQGYRYLDKCGEAMIRLEDTLSEGWIPGEMSPQQGIMANHRMGLTARFNSEFMNVTQTEFISYPHFRNEVCTLYEVLRSSFGIPRILSPCLQVILQTGFDQPPEMEAYIQSLPISVPSAAVLKVLGGKVEAVNSVITTTEEVDWQGDHVMRRRRVSLGGVRQEKRSAFDSRLLQRISLIPLHHQSALADLLKIRRTHPSAAPAAAQFDLEGTLEKVEFPAAKFDLPKFLDDTLYWAQEFQAWIRSQAKHNG